MPNPASVRVLQLIAAATLAAFLLAPTAARPQQKQLTQQQLEDRLKAIQAQLDAAEKKADRAEMQKDYIERVEADTKAYYDRAFNTQIIILTILGLIVGLVGRFGIDHTVAGKLAEAKAELRTEYGQQLAAELKKLKDSNATQIDELRKTTENKLGQLDQDLRQRAKADNYFLQGLTLALVNDHNRALHSFREALNAYVEGKGRNPVLKDHLTAVIGNILNEIKTLNPTTFEQAQITELQTKIYRDNLQGELDALAAQDAELAPVVRKARGATPGV